MSSSVVEIRFKNSICKKHLQNIRSRNYYLIKKEELGSLWEMQDVEDSKLTNESNNEEKKNHLHVGTQHLDKHVHYAASKKCMKSELLLAIHASKLVKKK